jgi:hypothetical protein
MARESVTVDNLPKSVNQSYADRTRLLSDEELKKVTQSSNIAQRAEAFIATARQDEASNLFGLNQATTFFEEPDNLDNANVFVERLVPSIKDPKDNLEKLNSIKTKNSLDNNQKQDLLNFVNDVVIKDKVAAFIKSKLNEFSKG